MSLFELRGVTRDYQLGKTWVHALRGVDLAIGVGEIYHAAHDRLTVEKTEGKGESWDPLCNRFQYPKYFNRFIVHLKNCGL